MKLMVIAIALLSAYWFFFKYQPSAEVSDTPFHIERGEVDTELLLKNEYETKDIVATMVTNVSRADGHGTQKVLHYFTPSSANTFEKKYGKSSVCPASFFNRHSNHMNIIPANNAIKKELSNWEQENFQDSSKWEEVTLSGNCVEAVNAVEEDGTRFEVRSKLASKCNYMVIDSIYRN